MGGVADAAPGDGDVSAVYDRVDSGGRSDIGCFGTAVEYGGIVCVKSSVVWVFSFISLRVQGTNHEITVTSSRPAPVEMEVIVFVVPVAYKRM